MGPTWVLSAPGEPHVGPMNLVIRNALSAWRMEILNNYYDWFGVIVWYACLVSRQCMTNIWIHESEHNYNNSIAMVFGVSICFRCNVSCLNSMHSLSLAFLYQVSNHQGRLWTYLESIKFCWPMVISGRLIPAYVKQFNSPPNYR